MKIGYDYTQPSLSPGGCGWHARSLLVEMARLAPESEFLAYRHFATSVIPAEQLAPLPKAANIRDPLPKASRKELIKTWGKVLNQEEAPPEKPDLVHSLCFQSPPLRGSKLVVTIFDLAFWAHPEYSTEATRLLCQKGVLDALKNADGLIFSSEHSRQEFDRLLPSYRRKGQIPSIVTPLGCRYAPILPDMANSAAARHGDYWLFVGSMEPRKNLVGLLDAYEAYAEGHPAPKPLHFVGGSGWKNDEIRAKLALLEARGLVKHLGVVSDEELPQIYQNAEAFLFPSWYEGFGLPVLEAMSQGCPVICSDRSSLPEVGGEAVLYIDPAAPHSITAAMRRLETEPGLRAKLITAGLAQVATFSWEKTARQTLDFYERVLAAPSTRTEKSVAPHTEKSKPAKQSSLSFASVPTPRRSFWQKWFPAPKTNQERIDALEAELLLAQQRISQLEGDTAARAAASEQRISQLEGDTAALSLASRSLLPALEKQLRTLVSAQSFPEKAEKNAASALETVQAAQALEADAFYAALEARWRGSRELIRERQSFYLPTIAAAREAVAASAPAAPPNFTGRHAALFERLYTGQGVLDLASGRGEWLQLLNDQGVPALGVDLNKIFLSESQGRGLDVVDSDVIAFLREAPSSSVAVITGFHIIEHLPFPVLHEFVRESLRVLRPGGIAIFETPNPRNILVSTLNFRLDPTHIHPINPDFIQFLLEQSGFRPVRLEFLTPYPSEFHVGAPEDPLAERFNALFYGAQDFAVIGTKP